MSSEPGTLNQLVTGAIVMGYAVAGLFFIRFWRQTRDRLFLIFAVSFSTGTSMPIAKSDERGKVTRTICPPSS